MEELELERCIFQRLSAVTVTVGMDRRDVSEGAGWGIVVSPSWLPTRLSCCGDAMVVACVLCNSCSMSAGGIAAEQWWRVECFGSLLDDALQVWCSDGMSCCWWC